jgi:hypothetical protein
LAFQASHRPPPRKAQDRIWRNSRRAGKLVSIKILDLHNYAFRFDTDHEPTDLAGRSSLLFRFTFALAERLAPRGRSCSKLGKTKTWIAET